MKKKSPVGQIIPAAVCLLTLAVLLALCPGLMETQSPEVPGLTGEDRVLLRIWTVNAPGGAQSWLTSQLKQFEKQHSGISTYLRPVSPEELTDPDAVLPDVVLYMPGDVSDPSAAFLPLSGQTVSDGVIREELLRCGRWQGTQYGLPVCFGAWVLAIDSALEPGTAVTPAPTTLLGKPAATASAGATPVPGYPLEAASAADCALQSPGGTALFTLGLLLADGLPPLPDDLAQLTSAQVYDGFRQRKWATAMLTTGQVTAFSSLTSAGNGFPFRVLTAEEVITDQVWLASVTPDAADEAALLLSFLTSSGAQEALTTQALHTVRSDLTLYASGTSADVEQAARRGLSAVNAYLSRETVSAAAWQFLQRMAETGAPSLSEALLPLL